MKIRQVGADLSRAGVPTDRRIWRSQLSLDAISRMRLKISSTVQALSRNYGLRSSWMLRSVRL